MFSQNSFCVSVCLIRCGIDALTGAGGELSAWDHENHQFQQWCLYFCFPLFNVAVLHRLQYFIVPQSGIEPGSENLEC